MLSEATEPSTSDASRCGRDGDEGRDCPSMGTLLAQPRERARGLHCWGTGPISWQQCRSRLPTELLGVAGGGIPIGIRFSVSKHAPWLGRAGHWHLSQQWSRCEIRRIRRALVLFAPGTLPLGRRTVLPLAEQAGGMKVWLLLSVYNPVATTSLSGSPAPRLLPPSHRLSREGRHLRAP